MQLLVLITVLAVAIGGAIARNQRMKAVMAEEDQPGRRVFIPGAEPLFHALNLLRIEVENARGGGGGTSVGVHADGGGVGVSISSGASSTDPSVQAEIKQRMIEVTQAWHLLGPDVKQRLSGQGLSGEFLSNYAELPPPTSREERKAMLQGIDDLIDRFTVL